MSVKIQGKEVTKSFFGLVSGTRELMAKTFTSLIMQTFSPNIYLKLHLRNSKRGSKNLHTMYYNECLQCHISLGR